MGQDQSTDGVRWRLATRVAFRFLFVYFLLSIVTPLGLFGALLSDFTGLNTGVGESWKQAVQWVGKTVFGVTITVLPAGSGDTTFNYVEVFCWAVTAAAATVVWSVVDWRRASYPRLFETLRVVVRCFLAVIMILYGTVKVVPTQFGTLQPSTLVTRVGELTPMSLLWSFMAASPAYTAFSGVVELMGGLLLVFRRTTLLGALVSAGALAQVVMLNYCYDVPVKLFSSHLLTMALFLIAPDARRLLDWFVLGRPVEPALLRPRFQRRWLNWVVIGLPKCLFLLLVLAALIAALFRSKQQGLFAPHAPLHGVWEVVEFERDGNVLPPLATDATRWREFLVQNFPGMIVIVTMTGEQETWKSELSEETRSMTFTDPKEENRKPPITLTYDEPGPGLLTLAGSVDGKAVRVKLKRVDEARFPLVSRGFHWVNERPYTR